MSEPPEASADPPAADEAPSAASQLFDLRTIIALLFAVYGIVLTVIGAAGTDQAELAKAGGININLWSGLAMIVVAALFLLWERTRPLRPPDPGETDVDTGPGPGH